MSKDWQGPGLGELSVKEKQKQRLDTVGPLYLHTPHPKNQTTVDQKYLRICICTEHGQTFFLPLFSKQYRVTTTYIAFILCRFNADAVSFCARGLSIHSFCHLQGAWASTVFAICRGGRSWSQSPIDIKGWLYTDFTHAHVISLQIPLEHELYSPEWLGNSKAMQFWTSI
jgi:hypothetical protein